MNYIIRTKNKKYAVRISSLLIIMIVLVMITVIIAFQLIIFNLINTQDEMKLVSNEAIETEQPVEPVEKEPFFKLSTEERKVVEYIVMGEAAGESYKGKLLVAQCILNACTKDGIQPSEVRKKYKYAGWNDKPDEDVKQAVNDIFDGGHKVTDEPILYFYAPEICNSDWHETQRYVLTEGGHKFFAELQ